MAEMSDFWYFVLSLFYSVYTMVHNATHKEKSSTNTTGTFIVCTFFFVFPSGICAMWIIVPTQLVLQMSSKSILHQDLTCIFKIPDEWVDPLLGINDFIIKMNTYKQIFCKNFKLSISKLLISANILLAFNSYNRLAACFGVTHWGNRKKDLKHLLSFDLDLFSSRSIAPCELIDVGDEISGTKTGRGGFIDLS